MGYLGTRERRTRMKFMPKGLTCWHAGPNAFYTAVPKILPHYISHLYSNASDREYFVRPVSSLWVRDSLLVLYRLYDLKMIVSKTKNLEHQNNEHACANTGALCDLTFGIASARHQIVQATVIPTDLILFTRIAGCDQIPNEIFDFLIAAVHLQTVE